MHARSGFVVLVVALGAIIPSSASAATNLGAFWHLDESSGTTAADSSGNGNHGTVNGATSISGRFERSLSFDGVDDSVAIPGSASLEPEAVTLEGWVRGSASPGPFKYIASKGATAGCDVASYALFTATGGVAFYVSAGSADQAFISPEAPSTIWDGAWHHVAGTYDGSTVRLYVDGVEIGSGTPATIAIAYGLPNGNALLGTFGGACDPPLNWAGDLDEPRVWHRALSATEITASAAMGAATTTKFGQRIETNQAITYTSEFEGQSVTISTESSTGTEQIDRVTLVGIIPLTSGATCSGGLLSILNSNCTITRSNGNRTARLTVNPLLGEPTVTLRVRMKSGRTFNVEVDTDD